MSGNSFWLIIYKSKDKEDNMTVIAKNKEEAIHKAKHYLKDAGVILKNVIKWENSLNQKQEVKP